MANRKLGIDVEIKYPTANQIKESINKEWQKVKGNFEVKVNVAPDGNSLKSMRKKIQSFLETADFDFELRINSVKAIADMREIRREVDNLRKATEDEIEIKFTGIKQQTKSLQDIAQVSEQTSKKQDKADTNRMARLREIMSLQKEMNSLQSKKVSAGANEQATYNKRIEELAVQLKLAKNEYKDMFGSNSDDEWMIDNVRKIGEFNVELKKAQQTQKETNQLVKDYTGLLNEEFKIQKDLQNAGENQSRVLEEQLAKVKERQSQLKESNNLEERMSDSQKEAVQALSQQNDYQLKLTQAKREDVELAKKQNDTFKELKTDMNEIHKMHLAINDLQAKYDAGVATGKEEEKLTSLRQQLIVREDMHQTSKDLASAEGLVTKEAEESLSILKRQHDEKQQISKETANLNADLKITSNLYDDLMSSLKRVQSLTKDLASAGSMEADTIRRAIRAEEDKQDEIRETIKLQERVNNAREDEYATMKRVTAEQEELNAERSVAKQTDTYRQNSVIGNILNPRNVYNEGKQVAMQVYEVVSTLDKQIVNIEKVADASETEMNAFKENVYDFASDVGVSADEYATSVERWVTQGYTLAEGMALARESTVGAFVGNIDESDMVDYMSVPLISFKEDGLEVEDVLNSMNEVANNNAVEMDDLGQAYKRASNTASDSGTSFSELTGLISGAQDATRLGGERIGTSLKAIDMNFSKIGTRLTDADQDRFDFFKNIGVNLEDGNGGLRSTYEILDDLSNKWETLSDENKSTAMFYGAGKNHAPVMSALVANWGQVEKATGEANEQIALFDKQSGSAYQEFAKQQESVEYAVAGLKNAWAEFIYEISGGRDGVKFVVDELAKLVEVATKLAGNETFMKFAKGFLKATLWLTAGIAMKNVFNMFSGGIMDIVGGVGMFLPKISTLFGTVKTGTKVVGGLKGAFAVAGGALSKLVPIIGIALGAMALLDLMGFDVIGTFKEIADGSFVVSGAIKDYKKAYQEASDAIKNNSLMNREFDEINEMLEKYDELNKEKEKLAEETKVSVTYSPEEFALLKEEFNAQADALDIDLEIAFNDYDHIKSQLDELEAQKKRLEIDSADELIENIKVKNALPTNQHTYKNELNEAKEKYNYLIKEAESFGREEEVERLQKIHDTLDTTSEEFLSPIFTSKDFQEAKKVREEAIESTREQRDNLVAIHDTLSPYDLGIDGSFFMSQELLPSLSDMQTDIDTFNTLSDILKEKGELNQEQARLLHALVPEVSNLGFEVGLWGEEQIETAQKVLEAEKETTEGTILSVENRYRALARYARIPEEEIESSVARMKGNQQEVISIMAELGETGRLALGVSEEALVMYGDQWDTVMITMQNSIDKLDEEKVFEYKLVTEDGYFNWDIIDVVRSMPEDVITKYELLDSNGVPRLEALVELLDTIPDEKLTEYGLKDSAGNFSLEEFVKMLNEMEDEYLIEFFADDTGYEEVAKAVRSSVVEIEESNPRVTFNASQLPFNTVMAEVNQKIGEADEAEAKPTFSAVQTEFDASHSNVLKRLTGLDGESATTHFLGDISSYEKVNNDIDAKNAKPKTVWVKFKGMIDNVIKKFSGGSDSLPVYPDAVTGATNSIGVGMTGIGTSNSMGMGVSASTTASSSKGNPRYAKETPPATVSTDVWRYWAKEMFKGIPLENSMDNLNKAITNASEDNKKLISLYKEQNKLVSKQVNYEKDMKKAQQSEMNSILSKLRKEGFKTSGNQITNLGITKNMKGEKAERSTDLLNQWKTLYQAMDSTNDKIKQLNQEIITNNKSVKTAQEDIKKAQEEEKEKRRLEAIEKELKSIEKSVKRAEGLLTNIQNDMNIFSTKAGFIGDTDYELKLTVTEEGINKASQNVKKLTDEFNKLSKISVKYEENVDGIQSELESLKTEILSNADSILAYRDAMKELQVQRMVNDFDKFANAMDSNLARITNGIDNLRDGLVSGQKLSDLASSSLMGVDFNRKTQLERQFEQRLELERELNEALDAFAKKNVDRVKNVANATLTIEKNKYGELLKLANGFSNGKVESVSITSPTKSIGSTKADTSKSKEYQTWLNSLISINNSYVKSYNSMVNKYDKAMSKAETASEKELLTNAMIIEQLKLQEDIYGSMMESNNKAIKNTQDMLKDSSLTTEQRQQLLDNIEEYKQSNINAQNSIKDSIQSRFDLEFEMIDEAISRAGKYTTELSNMMSIAEALGSGNNVMNELYRALYQSKINEYTKATDIIADLTKQQDKFAKGSFEWNVLQEKIVETQDSLSDLTLDILNANKDILGSQLDIIQEVNEKMALGGRDSSQYDKYISSWMDGVEKELELEKLRMKLVNLEDKSLQGKVDLMDRQEKVSRAELEYVDKQLEAVRLQEKLENIRDERNIQTLAKDSQGNWQWNYVADSSEYDTTKEELNNVKLEIEKYREEQRRNYVDEMNDIIGQVRDGQFDDIAELESAIQNVHEMFDDILGDLTDMSLYDTASIIKAYQDYISNNSDIISGVNGNKGFSDNMAEIGKTLEQAFVNITTDISKLIADELKNALNASPLKGGNTVVIEKQILEFPNVHDSSGLEEAFRDLPMIAKQISTTK